jgi:hypothetical protein
MAYNATLRLNMLYTGLKIIIHLGWHASTEKRIHDQIRDWLRLKNCAYQERMLRSTLPVLWYGRISVEIKWFLPVTTRDFRNMQEVRGWQSGHTVTRTNE